jgi:hypothetical protein
MTEQLREPGPITQKESETIHRPSDRWSDEYALKIAKSDFETAEAYRTQNIDPRLSIADQLYLAWNPPKMWEGTRIPRSNVGIFTCFEQIESLLPKLMTSIFADYPKWFMCSGRLGTSPEEARNVQDLMIAQMENLNMHGISTIREVFRRCFKDAFVYGNGVAELCWLSQTVKRNYTYREAKPETKRLEIPGMGMIEIPTGRIRRRIKTVPIIEEIEQPFLRNIRPQDFYIDPNCPSPIVSDAHYCCSRRLMAIDEIMAYDGTEGFDIPDNDTLIALTKTKPVAQGDYTKSQTEAMRQMWWQPQNDTSADAAGKKLEVIEYTTKDHKVWMLNRQRVIYNEPNPYGFINYYDFFYCDIPGRYYGFAVTDVLEGEQRVQTSIINARLDELALSIYKPIVKKRGGSQPAYQYKTRPGQVIEVENPREDIVFPPSTNCTQDAYIEVQASDNRAQKITGGSDLAILGTPSSGGNSANRTATGVGAQVQAVGSRIQYQVENNEDTVIEQVLSDWHTLNCRFLDPEKAVQFLGQAGEAIMLDPLKIMNSRVKMGMRASTKMASRTALVQSMPMILQTLMNPALMQELSKEGKAINWTEIERMLFDMMAYRSAEGIFRDMSDEEKQALNQPPMTEQIRMQMQRERLMGQKDIAEDKQLAAMTHDLLKGTQQHQNTLSENEQQSLNNTKQSLMEIAAQAKANPKPQGGEAT